MSITAVAFARADRLVSRSNGSVSRRSLVLIGLSALLCSISTAPAAEGADIIRVEEDWRIEIGTPNPAEEAPQIVTAMSPLGDLNGPYSVFELNYSTFPDYYAGGMQLQKWYSNVNFGYRNFPNFNQLEFTDEVIEFTSTMTVTDSDLTFEIRNGTSQTWGVFGGQGYLKTRYYYQAVSNLNAYSPDISTKNSRIGFASHRVKRFVLKAVRYYSATGLESTDTTERVVHDYQPQ